MVMVMVRVGGALAVQPRSTLWAVPDRLLQGISRGELTSEWTLSGLRW
jgi:hypothetical protein